ncbi:MAG: SufS family cysteine desulfurase [Bacteroidales bacterium]|nr:SufS family cysteine desulfurase [Candidatus Equibacterium intestinale]
MRKVDEIRALFPILDRKVEGKDLVYFDNAATSQRPRSVLDLQQELCSRSNANIHRAVHTLSMEATEAYEKGRDAVRDFLGAESREEIILTSGTTASINLVAHCFAAAGFLKNGDKVLLSAAEHHSNIVPWQIACQATGAGLKVLEVEPDGTIDLQKFSDSLTDDVKMVAVAHVSNILGVVNPVKQMVAVAHSKGIPVLVDGAQGVTHLKVDVTDIDCDFYAFSGHKIYAPTGIGVLYGKKEWLEKLPPYMGGGDMVESVSFEKTVYADLPLKFEAGTANYVAAACLRPALEIAGELASDAAVATHEKELMAAMESALGSINGVKVAGIDAPERIPLYSFTIEGVHPLDAAMLIDKMGVALRSGHMCAEPIVRRLTGGSSMLRASLMPYNTVGEVEVFARALARVVIMLRQ